MGKENLNLERQEKIMLSVIAHLSLDELSALQDSLLKLLDQTSKRMSFLRLLKKMQGE